MYCSKDNTSVTELCSWISLSKSVFYYKPTGGRPGAKPSTHTITRNGDLVTNEFIVEEIKMILQREFADWGYEITAGILKRDYIINEKKVYRLMDENNLLLNKHIKTSGQRSFVKFRSIEAQYPMEYLSMDIKYIWVAGEQRNYYLLSVIDVYSKRVIHSILRRSIRKKDVIDFLKTINDRNEIKGVKIRNDNGPQFIANQVKNYLRLAEVEQQFSHPATPQDNCYIEAFHSILDRAVVQRCEFESYYEAKETIERFIKEYNTYRPHRSVGMITPQEKWDRGMKERLTVKHQIAGATLSRPTDLDEMWVDDPSLSHGLDKVQGYEFCLTENLLCEGNFNEMNLNQIRNTVQFIGG